MATTMTAEQVAAQILAGACEQGLHVAGVAPADYQLVEGDLEPIAEAGVDEAAVRAAVRQLGLAADESLDAHLQAIGVDLADASGRAVSDADDLMGEEAWGVPADLAATSAQYRAIVRDLLRLRIQMEAAELASVSRAEQIARRAEALDLDGATDAEQVEELCEAAGADSEDDASRSTRRWTFGDGSGIVVQGAAWDVALADDARCHCWEGEGEHYERCALYR